MPPISLDEFLDMLRRSKLLEPPQIEGALEQYRARHEGASPPDGGAFADELLQVGLITAWQHEKLKNGRFRGFFLGRYKLLDQIGAGGMSRVLLAEHTLLKQRRALKVLPRERVSDSTYLARFQLEAQAIATLDHPNIVRAYDIDESGGIHYLVMEYVPGKDLQTLVVENGPLDFETAADYMIQAARGLEHAHKIGLVHRDVKPANLLIDPDGVVKILDLGLALFSETEASLTIAHNENVLGTADYLAPEQALNSHTIDGRADFYALGCTLYFALTGAPPFADGTIAQRIARHQSVTPPPLRNRRADCPEALEIICAGMLRKRPEERYQTAGAVAEALEQFLAGKTITTLAPALARAASSSTGTSSSVGIGAGRSDAPRKRPEFMPRRPIVPSDEDTIAERDADTRKGLPTIIAKQPSRQRPKSRRAKLAAALRSPRSLIAFLITLIVALLLGAFLLFGADWL